jgi:phage terminase large subunit GpA-like protein
MAIKGSKDASKPVIATRPSLKDVRIDGAMLKEGVKLWMIGVNTAKSVLYSRLRADIAAVGERMMMFPGDLPDTYYAMLTAESYDKRTGRFVNLHKRRNEALDTWGYAYAAALHPLVRIHMLRDADWKRIEAKVQPYIEPETTEPTPPTPPPQTPKPNPQNTRRKCGGYVKRY